MKKTYLIETMSTYRMRYRVMTDKDISNGDFQDIIDEGNLPDVSQDFLGEKVIGVTEVPADDDQTVVDLDEHVIIEE